MASPIPGVPRSVAALILVFSLAALGFLGWLLLRQGGPGTAPAWIQGLPAVNAGCNALSACLASLAVLAIRSGRRQRHARLMLTALGFSALFLVGYVVYHLFHGETHFGGQGWIRPVYFFILISHLCLSALVLPALLALLWWAYQGSFEVHRRWARRIFPVWIYVSLSGVLIYFFLRPYY